MQFDLSSEEFPDFQNSVYQGVVAVWVNGEQVLMAAGNGQANPSNISSSINENLYLDNAGDDFNTEMDRPTLTMTLALRVNPGELNDTRIGIADVGDSRHDSNLLIAADTVQTDLVAMTGDVYGAPDSSKTIDGLANDVNKSGAP